MFIDSVQMSSPNKGKITRRKVGAMPLLCKVAEKLGFRKILSEFIVPHGNEAVPAVDTLILLVYNLTLGRQPLYELEEWVSKFDMRIFGFEPTVNGIFNDDRFGRALDKLYFTDRASLMTKIVMEMIKVTKLDLTRVHNDSTTVKAFGKIPGTTRSGFFLARGNSKDHRPDLKQLVYCLTITADGAVPVHFKTYPGNRTDDTTHIETWNTLCKIAGFSHFLYVADCKVCTDKQLSYIVGRGGRIVTLVPETWSEVRDFKNALRKKKKAKKLVWRRKIPGKLYYGNESSYESYYCFEGHYRTQKRKYTVSWIYSTEKKKRDRLARLETLAKTERDLTDLMSKINTRNLKTKENISNKASSILERYRTSGFYHIDIIEAVEKYRVQVGSGRPGPGTKYKIISRKTYSLSWSRNRASLAAENNVDGIFPVLCTDDALTAREALVAYKYQPRLEKRFTQFKSIHSLAPLLFKKIERVESMMFVFFLALILQAVIEREVRKIMKDKEIDTLPIYPEHRLAEHPTTAIICDRFEDIALYQLSTGKTLINEYKDELSDIHKKILELLNISEFEYWPN